ncbi:hypothetical protein, partial [Campylobacter peloridis]|uniref:hypothetical protein n=1 Tax=Campylobacter peloridis TaxID=488546 RepID=UPI001C739A46
MNKEKLIVVFGESHFITKNGLLKGLENRKTKILNLALGGTSTLQSVYELKRYYKKIKGADLIIIGSNTCDCMHYHYYKTNFVRDIEWFYKELYDLNTRILCIINPTFQDRLKLSLVAAVINTHKKNCLKYGFNCIDLHGYYYEKELIDFHREKDGEHDFSFIMRELGKNIINNLNYLMKPINNIKFNNKNPNFYICKRNDFSISREVNSSLVIQKQNSLYDEEILNLKNNMLLKIMGYENCILLGIHYWGMEGTIVFEKENSKNYLSFHTIHNHFRDLSNFDIKISDDLNVYMKDSSSIGLISFLLVEDFKNFFITFEDILYLSKQNIVIPNKYNFNHLIPPICLYKEIINEYCSIVIPRKLEKIQIQLSETSNRLYRVE